MISAETGLAGHDDATKYQVKAMREALVALVALSPALRASCTFDSQLFGVADG